MLAQPWLDANKQLDYPFIALDPAVAELRPIIVDAGIQVPYALRADKIVLNRLFVHAGTPAWDVHAVLLASPFDDIPADPRIKTILTEPPYENELGELTTFESFVLNDRWLVWTWRAAKAALMLVLDRPLAESTLLPGSSFSLGAAMVPHTISFMPQIVDTVRAVNLIDYIGESTDAAVASAGDIELEAGYNIEFLLGEQTSPLAFTPTPERRLARQRLTLSAVAGAGQGRYAQCDGAGIIASINNVTPDANGDLKLALQDCMWYERPGSNVGDEVDLTTEIDGSPASILLHQNCAACCACQEYWDLYARIAAQWEQLKSIHAELEAVVAEYEDVVAALQAAENAKCDVPVMAAKLFPKPGWTVGVQLLIQNPRACDLPNVSISGLTLSTSLGGTVAVIAGTAYRVSGGRQVTAWSTGGLTNIGTIYRDRFEAFTCDVFVSTPHTLPQTVTVSATVTVDGVDTVVQETASLLAPFNK